MANLVALPETIRSQSQFNAFAEKWVMTIVRYAFTPAEMSTFLGKADINVEDIFQSQRAVALSKRIMIAFLQWQGSRDAIKANQIAPFYR